MKQIVVLSGKGGTGKTTVAAALAERASESRRVVLVDGDVDAANLGILLDPVPVEWNTFPGGEWAVIDTDVCAGCGECADACRFDAIRQDARGTMEIDSVRCEGCGACLDACPMDSIHLTSAVGGTWWRSDTSLGPFFHAELEPGEENSGRLVTTLRRAAQAHAESVGADLVLIDGPPGIGCPAIAACTGADLAVVVTEPSLFGAHDLARALDLLRHFDIPAVVCINRADLAPERAEAILTMAEERGLARPIRIPYDESVLRAVRAGRAVGRGAAGPASEALNRLATQLEER